jgi:hypothetical protein
LSWSVKNYVLALLQENKTLASSKYSVETSNMMIATTAVCVFSGRSWNKCFTGLGADVGTCNCHSFL